MKERSVNMPQAGARIPTADPYVADSTQGATNLRLAPAMPVTKPVPVRSKSFVETQAKAVVRGGLQPRS